MDNAYAENPDYVAAELQTEYDQLTLGDLSNVTANIELPSKGKTDETVLIKWSSSNPALIDANGVANVELDDAGRFTVYVEAASNPLVEADLPFAPMDLEERADGRPSDYVLTTMDVCAFNQNVFDYLMDLETVTSLMRELKDDDPRYWQLAKALQKTSDSMSLLITAIAAISLLTLFLTSKVKDI